MSICESPERLLRSAAMALMFPGNRYGRTHDSMAKRESVEVQPVLEFEGLTSAG